MTINLQLIPTGDIFSYRRENYGYCDNSYFSIIRENVSRENNALKFA